MGLKKVELGCGASKTPGYIGIDRFDIPGVDIVADLNKGIPLESDSVDVLYASHSLEHFDDIKFMVKEIYRVCKDMAIVNILAPYANTDLDRTNIYHNVPFNAHTFRFFTNSKETNISKDIWKFPHAEAWGLGESDNSEVQVDLRCINIEFFYFEEYRALAEREKSLARNSLNNVCDQVLFSLIVCKENHHFTDEDLDFLKIKAKNYLSETHQTYLLRKQKEDEPYQSHGDSLFAYIEQKINKNNEDILEQINKLMDERFQGAIDKDWKESASKDIENLKSQKNDIIKNVNLQQKGVKEELFSQLNKVKKELDLQQNKLINTKHELEAKSDIELSKIVDKVNELNQYLQQVGQIEKEMVSVRTWSTELYKGTEVKTSKKFNRAVDISQTLRITNTNFFDTLALKNKMLSKKSILTLSKSIPFSGYNEYLISGIESKLNILMIGQVHSKVLTEIVKDNTIIEQCILTITHDGHYTIDVSCCKEESYYIRFKALDNASLVRILEINNPKYGGLRYSTYLACF